MRAFLSKGRDSRHPGPEFRRKPFHLSCTSYPSSRTNWRALGDLSLLVHDADGDRLLVKVDADEVHCRAPGLGKRGSGKTPQVFPRFRGSANRRVDFHLPLIASISGRRQGAWGEGRVAWGGSGEWLGILASGEWRKNSGQWSTGDLSVSRTAGSGDPRRTEASWR